MIEKDLKVHKLLHQRQLRKKDKSQFFRGIFGKVGIEEESDEFWQSHRRYISARNI